MKKLTTLLLLLIGVCVSFAQNHLYRIVANNKTGYIDNSGKIIIQPKYNSGTDFFGEYAAVRENGLYGIINTKGKYVLKPTYPIIQTGLETYVIGKTANNSALIDLSGKINFRGNVLRCAIQPDYLFAYTDKNETYVFDKKTGKQVLYSKYCLSIPYKGNCIATNIDNDGNRETYLTDLRGNILVPENTYKLIDNYKDDVACVQIDNDTYGAIDLLGKLLFTTKHNLFFYENTGFSEGYAVIELQKPKRNENDFNTRYYGYIDKTGKLVYSDTTFTKAYPFTNGQATVELHGGEYKIIDRNFKEIVSYNDETKLVLKNDYNLVQADKGWRVLDKSGNEILRTEVDVESLEEPIVGHLLFYSQYKEDKEFFGFINLKTKEKTNAIFEKIDTEGFKDEILAVKINGTFAYVNESGKIVWQESGGTSIRPLNIDFMLRGIFSAYDITTKKSNGWATSDNIPKKNMTGQFAKNKLNVVISTTAKTTFLNSYKGITVYVANTTSKNIAFDAMNSKLTMIIQAKDADGKWKDITFLPRSWCGNSYHSLTLPVNEHWEFSMPVFDGSMETEIRIKLTPEFKKKEFYSNSIKARINPAQFFYQQQYYPKGIMDPYSN